MRKGVKYEIKEKWTKYMKDIFEKKTCKTHDRCMIMMHEPDEYILCKSNVPHVTCYECFMKLENKTCCPYCRQEFEMSVYINE
jgi:hypothetical protein